MPMMTCRMFTWGWPDNLMMDEKTMMLFSLEFTAY